MLAQPAVETLRLLLKFSIHDYRVLDFGACDMECFGLHRNRVRAGSVGLCVIHACYWSGLCQKFRFLLTDVNYPFRWRVCACLYTLCMFTGPFLTSGVSQAAFWDFAVTFPECQFPTSSPDSSCPVFGFSPAARDIIPTVHEFNRDHK